MARYRILLIISPVVLAVIVMALYNHQSVDGDSQPYQPVSVISEPEQTTSSLAVAQNISSRKIEPEVQLPAGDQLISIEARETPTETENITVSGWVGTELGEYKAFEKIILYSPSLRAHYSMFSNSSGEFMFTDLKPAWDYVLKVTPQGLFKRYIKSPIKLRYDQEVHNIVLESIPLGILTGRVVDPYDRPVGGIGLLVQTLETDFWSARVVTDANGNFSVAEFPKGKFQLSTRGQQLLRATGLKFDPDADLPFNLTIDLGPYNLKGRIYDESGQTFDGASIILIRVLRENDVMIQSTRQVDADASGEFRFAELGPGEHKLIISAWREDAFGKTIKKTVRQTVNVGVDAGELNIFFDTM